MKRKLLATILAVAMLFSLSTVQAFATDTTGDGKGSGSGENNGTGGVVDASLHKTLVTLPTSANMNFDLDPQGIAAADYGAGEVTLGSLTPNDNIIMKSATGAMIVNRSSYPVVVQVTAKLTGDVISTAEADLGDDDKNNAYLYVLASTAATAESADASTTNRDANFSGTVKAIDQLTTTDKSAVFALDEAVYVITESGTPGNYTYSSARKDDSTGDATKIQLGGKINLNADWTAYSGASATKTIGVSIKFNFKEGTGDAIAFSTSANYQGSAYRLLTTTIANDISFVTSLFAQSAITIPVNNTLINKAADFDFRGAANKAAAEARLTLAEQSTDGGTTWIPLTDTNFAVNFGQGGLAFNFGAAGTRIIRITYDGIVSTITVTLTSS